MVDSGESATIQICRYCWIEVTPILNTKDEDWDGIIGNDENPKNWKHVADRSPTGTPRCQRVTLSDEDIQEVDRISE